MPLTDSAIKAAKPAAKPYKLSDSQGLYLLINPNGSKLWRLKYRMAGKEKLLSFGTYPTVTLLQARRRRDEAKLLLSEGKDPSVERQAERINKQNESLTFESLAREWHAYRSPRWAKSTADKAAAYMK
ncbi:TPA: Arm DNA-binding domain-containing protein, partial [Pseudomonas aeruginosa]